MDSLLLALAGFILGILVGMRAQRGCRRREGARPADAAARQSEAFLRGIKAFERGVAVQVERDRRAARLRSLLSSRNRVL